MRQNSPDRIQYRHIDLGNGIDLLEAEYYKQHFSKHSHAGYAFGVVTKGQLDFSYLQQTWQAQPGDINLVFPGEIHDGHGNDERGWAYKMLYLPANTLKEIYSQRTGKEDFPWFTAGVVQHPALGHHLLQLYMQLATEKAAPFQQASALVEWLTPFIEAYSAQPVKQQFLGHEDGPIHLCLDYLQDNYQDDISLDDLAALTHLSPYYLLRSFKKAIGVPPHLYQQQLRISKAKELLSAGYSPARTANDLGYVDQSHFSRQFKQITGLTPGSFAACTK